MGLVSRGPFGKLADRFAKVGQPKLPHLVLVPPHPTMMALTPRHVVAHHVWAVHPVIAHVPVHHRALHTVHPHVSNKALRACHRADGGGWQGRSWCSQRRRSKNSKESGCNK